jgi:hypothetical protein
MVLGLLLLLLLLQSTHAVSLAPKTLLARIHRFH